MEPETRAAMTEAEKDAAVSFAVQACPVFTPSLHPNAYARRWGALAVCIQCQKPQHQHWLRAAIRAQHAAEQEAALQRQRAEQAEQDVAEIESVLATCRSELVENVREYNEQKARAEQAEQQLEQAKQQIQRMSSAQAMLAVEIGKAENDRNKALDKLREAEQQLEAVGQRWANERQDLVGRLDRAQRTIDRLNRDSGKR